MNEKYFNEIDLTKMVKGGEEAQKLSEALDQSFDDYVDSLAEERGEVVTSKMALLGMFAFGVLQIAGTLFMIGLAAFIVKWVFSL